MLRFFRSAAPILLAPLALMAAFSCGGAATGADASSAGQTSTGGVTATGGDQGASGGANSATGGTQSDGTCTPDNECAGRCSGTSCVEDWKCETNVPCTEDLAQYCGCDGVTFTGSGSCPPRAYSKKGPCDVVSCDPAEIKCLPIVAPEPCPEGHVYSVVSACYGACVPISQCECSAGQACPETDKYVCHNSAGHCDYYVD